MFEDMTFSLGALSNYKATVLGTGRGSGNSWDPVGLMVSIRRTGEPPSPEKMDEIFRRLLELHKSLSEAGARIMSEP